MNPFALLLGAGASVAYGVPMMREFYIGFMAHVQERYPLCAELATRLASTHGRSQQDLETLMTDLQAVLGIAPGLSILGLDDRDVSSELYRARELRGYLDAFIIDTCERFARDEAAADTAELFALAELGSLWMFTTNYDRILEHACDAARMSFADGFTQPASAPVADWSDRFDERLRVVKLHGSVNWYVDDPGGDVHRLDRGYALPAHDFRLTRGEHTLRPLMIIPTLEKQAITEPYVQLATHFADVLRDARVLLVIGNSLRDDHIRGVIRTRMDRLHVMLINPDAGNQGQLLGVSERTHRLAVRAEDFYKHGVKELAAIAPGITSGDDQEVHRLLRQCIERVEATIAEELAWTSSEELRRVRRALGDATDVARRDAVLSLQDEGHPSVVAKISDLLQTDLSPEVRVAAVGVLLRSRGSLALDSFEDRAIHDTAVAVRIEAVLAIGTLLPDGDAMAALQRVIGSNTDEVTREIARDICGAEAVQLPPTRP